MKNYYLSYYPSYVTSPSQTVCQGHILNGCCTKLAPSLDAKVGILILSDPRQRKKCSFSFHSFDFAAPVKFHRTLFLQDFLLVTIDAPLVKKEIRKKFVEATTRRMIHCVS